jgi:PAS domain S-box-containing protein
VDVLPDTLFPALVEQLPDAVVIVGRTGTIEFLNAQTEALFGYERPELIGKPVEMLVPTDFRALHERHRTGFTQRPGVRAMGAGGELWGQRKDRSLFPVEISLSPLVRGAQMYVTSVIRDLSERNQMRNEIEMEHERQRIAMDLHDGTIQGVYAIGLGLELALGEVVNDPVAAGRRIDASIEQLNTVVSDIRAYIFDLRPMRYSGDLLHDLVTTVEEYRAGAPLDVKAHVPDHLPALREDRAAAMLQIARESLSNIRKHAGASNVAVTITDHHHAVTMEVRDDGAGFSLSGELPETHRGLRNMRLRTQRLGGVFDIESAPGHGATVRVRMPAST